MCTYSMVVDHYSPLFRPFIPTTWPTVPNPLAPIDADAFEKLRKEFFEALAAAKTVDTLTKQPDCEDPEKAKLVARVAALEEELTTMKKRRSRKKKKAERPKAQKRNP